MSGSSASVFDPLSPEAQAMTDLWVVTLWICAGIFAVVAGIAGHSVARHRWREGMTDPARTSGNAPVAFVWAVMPFAIA